MPTPYEEMGYQLTLWVGAAGGTAGTQVTSATDVDYDLNPTKAPTADRGTGGNVPIGYENVTQRQPVVTWKMHNNQNDTFLINTILPAAIAGLPIAIKLVTAAGATILDGDFTMAKKLTAPLPGEQVYEFTATPTKQAGRTCTIG